MEVGKRARQHASKIPARIRMPPKPKDSSTGKKESKKTK
jgi:hypothetical protein